MTIKVDCNNDRIQIDSIEMPCKHPIQTIRILDEIFNSMGETDMMPITLIKIDEDTETIIGEW